VRAKPNQRLIEQLNKTWSGLETDIARFHGWQRSQQWMEVHQGSG